MSGGLDEALERMARWEALRRRMAGPGRGDPVVEELIEAIGQILHRHGEVAVTLAVEGTAEPATLRLYWQDGRLAVDPVDVSPPAPPAAPESTPEPETPGRETPGLETPGPETPGPETPGPEGAGWPESAGWPEGPARRETPEQTAARLAALIRQDPSVLRRDGVTD